jgi:predicted XRE-type DNA-binding protein
MFLKIVLEIGHWLEQRQMQQDAIVLQAVANGFKIQQALK